MKKPKPSTVKNKATALHSILVRARGRCENCGSTRNLQCAHIVSRRFAATRTDLENAFCLCAGCHMYFTHWPVEFGMFVEQKIGLSRYEALSAKANAGVKAGLAFWQGELDRLKLLDTRTDVR